MGARLGWPYARSDVSSRLQITRTAESATSKLLVKVRKHVPFPLHGQRQSWHLLCVPKQSLTHLRDTRMLIPVVVVQCPPIDESFAAQLTDSRPSDHWQPERI